MRFFIECGSTYESAIHTGIQRVVRNIANASLQLSDSRDVHLVFVSSGNVLPLSGPIKSPSRNSAKSDAYRSASTVKRFAIRMRRSIRKRLTPFLAVLKMARNISPSRGDVLILADATWQYQEQARHAIDTWRKKGGLVYALIYDLTPISHSDCYPEEIHARFQPWAHTIAEQADAYICISKAVMNEWRSFLAQQGNNTPRKPVSYFWLGSDLDLVEESAAIPVRKSIIDACASVTPTYLFVGILMPRKNHDYALDAFEQLWAQGIEANLIIAGSDKWKNNQALLARLNLHSELGRHLTVINNATDAEVMHMYMHANGLVFTSIAEGFGLPIVEALQNGMPAFVSDLAVFREVNQDGVTFVDLSDPGSLSEALAHHIQSGAKRLDSPVVWQNWKESTDQFWDAIDGLNHMTGNAAK